MAVFLFYGATFASKDETYSSALDVDSKNYSLGVEQKRIKISKNVPILRLFHHVGRLTQTSFEVVDDSGNVICTLSEQDLKKIAVKNKLTTMIGDVLQNTKI